MTVATADPQPAPAAKRGFKLPSAYTILFALIDGVSQHYVLEPSRYPLDAVIEKIAARYTPTGRPAKRAR